MFKNITRSVLGLAAGIALFSSPTLVTAQCASNTIAQCLAASASCHLDYSADPVVCVNGAATGCGAQTTQSSCQTNHCLWDPFVGSCFTSLSAVNTILPCSSWDASAFGYSTSACLWHSCSIDTDGSSCVAYSWSGVSPADTVSLNNTVFFGSPSVTQDTTVITGTISIPIKITDGTATQYIFQIGTTSSGGSSQWSQADTCNSLSTSMTSSQPAPVYYAGGAAALKTALITWVQANHNFDFDTATPSGAALAAYYGNITVGQDSMFLKSVDISTDQSTLIFSYAADMNQLYDSCSSKGVGYYNQLSMIYWSVPFSVFQLTSAGTWSSSTIGYSISFSTTGSVTVSEAISFAPSAQIVESVIVQGSCPVGQTSMKNTINVIYSNVYDSTRVVGPRSVSDILMRTDASGLANCYGDIVSSVGTTVCNSVTHKCTTPIVLTSRCRDVTFDGNAFQYCSYAQPSDITIDLGSPTATYPNSMNQVHSFFSQSYNCPAGRVDDSGCKAVNPSPNSPDKFTTVISLSVYPTTFTTVPPLSVDFGLLQYGNASFSSGGITSTGLINGTSTVLGTPTYQLPSDSLFNRLNVVIRLTEENIRNAYGLYFLVGAGNLTVQGLDSDGNLIPSPVLGWTEILPYITALPKLLAESTTCKTCQQLAVCVGVSGCDGFSIPMSALTYLIPEAGAFWLDVSYGVVLPAPTSYEGPSGFNGQRRLLSMTSIAGDTVMRSQAFYVNSSQFIEDEPAGGWAGLPNGTKAVIITVPIVVVILCVIGLFAFFYLAKPRRTSTRAARATRSRFSAV